MAFGAATLSAICPCPREFSRPGTRTATDTVRATRLICPDLNAGLFSGPSCTRQPGRPSITSPPPGALPPPAPPRRPAATRDDGSTECRAHRFGSDDWPAGRVLVGVEVVEAGCGNGPGIAVSEGADSEVVRDPMQGEFLSRPQRASQDRSPDLFDDLIDDRRGLDRPHTALADLRFGTSFCKCYPSSHDVDVRQPFPGDGAAAFALAHAVPGDCARCGSPARRRRCHQRN
jgi:hypothetical protein